MEVNATNLSTESSGATVSFENLYPAIVQCFVIILFGYIAGRWDVITPLQGKGIGTFVAKFCLPALLFKNMCILNFADVNWIFLLCILIAKSVVFFLVTCMALCLVIKRPRNYGIAGLFAIFATQSNDFALGFPLLQSLYADNHPEYLKYIYLIAPISVIVLNPIGFVLLEIQKHREMNTTPSEIKGRGSCMPLSIGVHVIKGVITNPIVFMTVIGIAGNFVFHRNIPNVLSDILDVFGKFMCSGFDTKYIFLLSIKRYNFREYKDEFTGVDICDWLTEVGLVHDRGEAVKYGRTLLIGRVIAHVKNEHHFHDLPYFYFFLDDEEAVLMSIKENT